LLEEINLMRTEAVAERKTRKLQLSSSVAQMESFMAKAANAKKASKSCSGADLHKEALELMTLYVTASDFSKRDIVFKPLDIQGVLSRELGTRNWLGETMVSHQSAG